MEMQSWVPVNENWNVGMIWTSAVGAVVVWGDDGGGVYRL
jgi:hypothetical protein